MRKTLDIYACGAPYACGAVRPQAYMVLANFSEMADQSDQAKDMHFRE